MKFHLFANLEKEIRSRNGELHFKRWSLLQTPWFQIYLHKIYESDKDEDMHDHPWDFTSIILDGGYIEEGLMGQRIYSRGDVIRHIAEEPHKIQLTKKPTTTLVIVGKYRRPLWGYTTPSGWVDFKTYREQKHAKKEND